MKLINDSEMFPGSGMRWITVAPEGCPTELSLFPMGGQWEHYREAMGKPQCFTLHCDDIDETYRELAERGVPDPDAFPHAIPGRTASAGLGQFCDPGGFRGQSNRAGSAQLTESHLA